jgi:hypothetical protein
MFSRSCGILSATMQRKEISPTPEQASQSRQEIKRKEIRIGIDISKITPEMVKELTTGSKIDRDRAALRWQDRMYDEYDRQVTPVSWRKEKKNRQSKTLPQQ